MKPFKLVRKLRIDRPKKFRLADVDPADCAGFDIEKDVAKAILAEGTKRLAELQERLYAQDRWAVLAMFQAMDAAGKDGAIKHVMSGVNPQGVEVTAFKAPSSHELDHDFMWRSVVQLPERGRIGIHNRSYYEEVLVVRVHRELLERQRLPPKLVTKHIWQERFEDIAAFERYLGRNGIKVVKFFLHVSREEQRRRFLDRLEEPAKRWKFSMADVVERKLWDRYMEAYDDMIRHTSTPDAPWYVIPADNKWFARLMVAAALIDTMEQLDLQYPKVEGAALREMMEVRQALLAGEGSGRRR
ncbi:MAG TPA: polyphosphate kinase 2 family protein [Xanthobacteraceae bacterium]|nr:polyphosphate kinase 2 family protein [Xanthobacteraceae bacterium]